MLNFTAGIEPAFNLHGDAIKDRNGYAIALPMVRPAGTVFTYGPSHLQIFCEVLRRKLLTFHQTPITYIQTRVLTPLGIHSLDFKKDQCGNPLLASGFRLTAREWARLGTLLLHKGFHGGRKIVEASLLEQCFRGSMVNPAFGIGFWNNRQASDPNAREPDIENLLELKWYQQAWDHVCICRDAPSDMVVSLGSGYQRLYVIPSLNLIVVRQGLDAKFSDTEFLRILLRG